VRVIPTPAHSASDEIGPKVVRSICQTYLINEDEPRATLQSGDRPTPRRPVREG
jgi:hypothetical protein